MLDQRDRIQVSMPATPAFAAVSSYVVGPLDPAQVTSLQVHLSTGRECSLLIPIQLPSALLTHPAFKEGYEWGYEEEEYTRTGTIPKPTPGRWASSWEDCPTSPKQTARLRLWESLISAFLSRYSLGIARQTGPV